MLRITVELIPKGIESSKRTIAMAAITNDGSGDHTTGNYVYTLSGKQGTSMQSGRVTGFPRTRKHVWDLLKLVLEDAR